MRSLSAITRAPRLRAAPSDDADREPGEDRRKLRELAGWYREFAERFHTRLWSSRGFCLACPRDLYLVVGDEIIETSTCWRSRHFEGDAYRTLFKEYFADGARWTAAPRPQLPDELFDTSYRVPEPGDSIRYIINEFEPVFDAADVARCGRDLFITLSNATNEAGIRWLRRHLGDRGLRLHQLESRCSRPMHIDTTFVPLPPGRAGKSRLHRCRPFAADPDALGCADRAQPRSGRRPDGEVQNVQPVDQHQRADAGPQARGRGSLTAELARGFERLGVRASAVTIPCLWPLWRRLPLRHIGHQASWRARGLLLGGLLGDPYFGCNAFLFR
jgi:hypothetical protein